MRNFKSESVREGNEMRMGVVTKRRPVKFHEHRHGHWLTACGLIQVETEHHGTYLLNAGEVAWVEAGEKHRLTVPHDNASYTCVGKAPL